MRDQRLSEHIFISENDHHLILQASFYKIKLDQI
jgi:hypothetical protein